MTSVHSVVESPEIVVVTLGEQGPRGADGSSGDSVVNLTANENMSAYRAIVSDGADGALLADNTIASHKNRILGVSETAAGATGSVRVRTYGAISFAGWSWTVNEPIFVGAAGALTQIPPVTPALFSCIIAVATSPTTIMVGRREVVSLI